MLFQIKKMEISEWNGFQTRRPGVHVLLFSTHTSKGFCTVDLFQQAGFLKLIFIGVDLLYDVV